MTSMVPEEVTLPALALCRNAAWGSPHHLHTFSIGSPHVPVGLGRSKGRGRPPSGVDAMRRVGVIVALTALLACSEGGDGLPGPGQGATADAGATDATST